MRSFKKIAGGVVVAGVVAAGGVAASVALASHTSTTWTQGKCSGAAYDSVALTKTVGAVLAGSSKSGGTCSITISGKFTMLPAKTSVVKGVASLAKAAGSAGTYTGTVRSPTFTGMMTVAGNPTLTINPGPCGWTYIFVGGHWIATTTC
jgi:hypothetical protein